MALLCIEDSISVSCLWAHPSISWVIFGIPYHLSSSIWCEIRTISNHIETNSRKSHRTCEIWTILRLKVVLLLIFGAAYVCIFNMDFISIAMFAICLRGKKRKCFLVVFIVKECWNVHFCSHSIFQKSLSYNLSPVDCSTCSNCWGCLWIVLVSFILISKRYYLFVTGIQNSSSDATNNNYVYFAAFSVFFSYSASVY